MNDRYGATTCEVMDAVTRFTIFGGDDGYGILDDRRMTSVEWNDWTVAEPNH